MNDSLRLTYALRNPDTAVAAANALAGATGRIEVEGLVELLHDAPSRRAVSAAIQALNRSRSEIILDGLLACLDDRRPSIRAAATRDLRARLSHSLPNPYQTAITRTLLNALQADSSWTVRREALWAIHQLDNKTSRRAIRIALNDPHWRVRHACIEACLNWPETSIREFCERERASASNDTRQQGVIEYLDWRRHEVAPASRAATDNPSARSCLLWDPDPAVLSRRLEGLDAESQQTFIDHMPGFLAHDTQRVRRLAKRILQRHGQVAHFVQLTRLLNEPRHPCAHDVEDLLSKLDQDRAEQIARAVIETGVTSDDQRGWAQRCLDTICEGRSSGEIEERPMKRRQLDNTTGSLKDVTATERLRLVRAVEQAELDRSLIDALQSDLHPCVRAAALTGERAARLIENPEAETSWHVLAQAARIKKVPFWKLEPDRPWRLDATETTIAPPINIAHSPRRATRKLGPLDWEVCPLGISGHYRLPAKGFVRAVEAGVNLMFWEPNYDTMIEFATRLAPAQRRRIHLVAGTFEADKKRVRQDAERALRQLKIEQLAVFLLFWVRTWARVSDEVRRTLEDLQTEGKIAAHGLSTHSRSLAMEAIVAGWNPVMVRHSAAHRGAEAEIFPAAAASGTSLITFNSTCYGRLIRRMEREDSPLTAADCYRYSLAQPAVTACWCAPATVEQLDQNLRALDEAALPPDKAARLAQVGTRVYEEDRVFDRLVKSR